MQKDPSSFRDSDGFVFQFEGLLYRAVHREYLKHLEFFTASGLEEVLFKKAMMVSHRTASLPQLHSDEYPVYLEPEKVPVITYPFEWCFSQLKAAALLTLDILRLSLEHGMILKDGSAYNVQFIGTKPVFIDTLSLAIYQEGQPWYGYRQFCEHFLAPLCIGRYLGVNFMSMNRNLEGFPVPLASRILPWTTWLKPAPLMHIHLHASSIGRAGRDTGASKSTVRVQKNGLIAMAEHLRAFVRDLDVRSKDRTVWQDYDRETHYSDEAKTSKKTIVAAMVDKANPNVIWDIGANDGTFSRLVATPGRIVLSMDGDPGAVDRCFRNDSDNVYPVLYDVMNPSPALGWANEERKLMVDRVQPQLVMALAVVHHISITNNVPFELIADYFARLAPWLVIEFVPPTDNKVLNLPDTAGKAAYNRQHFEKAFLAVFDCLEEREITGSGRSLLLMRSKLV